MPVTITAGITFSGGGLTMSLPPSVATAGWFGGGFSGPPYARTSTVARITFATDTATPTTRGPLSATRYKPAATGTLSYGWYGGGNTPAALSSVDRITFASDTSTAAVRGPLSSAKYSLTATTDNTTYGWFIAGFLGGPYSGGLLSTIDRITYATDTDTASVRGPVSASVYAGAATTNTTYGWFSYGRDASIAVSTVARITYATDTNSPTVRGPLSAATYQIAATGTTSYGWYAGGRGFASPEVTTINRIDYSNDTAIASVRGPLTIVMTRQAASTDGTTYGWFGGGSNSYSAVMMITYATDTATVTTRAPFSPGATGMAASAGIQ